MSKIVIQEGWARVKGKIEELKKIQNEAQKCNKGFFNKEFESRALPTPSDVEYNRKVLETHKDKPTLCVIEEVVNASLYKVTLLVENRTVFLILDGVVGWGTENE